MAVLERLLATIAPHDCMVCETEGAVLCSSCSSKLLTTPPSRCYRCRSLTKNGRTCSSCRSRSSLHCVWVASEYQGISRELIKRLKFQHVRGAAEAMSNFIDTLGWELPSDSILVPLPTATSRIRARGYDQSELFSKTLAKRINRHNIPALARLNQTRQVGTKRAVRLKQLESAFRVRYENVLKGAHVVLVDDVITTGATLESAAKVLRAAGAKHVDAVVFAQA